jgi:putative Mn2+ efflux pump MntP
MAEQAGEPRSARSRVSIIGLLFAVAFFAVASVGFTGDPWWLLSEATKWVVAGIIAVVGVGLLVSALPHRQRKSVE